jgi:uncharacterized protein (TIGR02172 family)
MDKKGRMLGQGNTAEIYEWETDKILKLYRKGLPDALCEGEFNTTKNVYDLLQITPKPIKTVYIDGRFGAVYERIPGKTMLKEMISKPWIFNRYSRMLAQFHINIQKPINFELPTVKEKLKRDIEASSLLSNTEKQKIYQYIKTLPDGNILCHFDFHPDNIMLSDCKNIIIDWMTACKGDGLSDVARTSVILKYSEIPRVPRFVNTIFRCIKKKICKGYLKEYLKMTGVQTEKIKAWEMPIAAARLREWIPQREKQTLLTFVRKTISNLPSTSTV